MGGARGISNVMLERRATIDVRSGRLLLVHTQQAGSGATPAQREQ